MSTFYSGCPAIAEPIAPARPASRFIDRSGRVDWAGLKAECATAHRAAEILSDEGLSWFTRDEVNALLWSHGIDTRQIADHRHDVLAIAAHVRGDHARPSAVRPRFNRAKVIRYLNSRLRAVHLNTRTKPYAIHDTSIGFHHEIGFDHLTDLALAGFRERVTKSLWRHRGHRRSNGKPAVARRSRRHTPGIPFSDGRS